MEKFRIFTPILCMFIFSQVAIAEYGGTIHVSNGDEFIYALNYYDTIILDNDITINQNPAGTNIYRDKNIILNGYNINGGERKIR